MFWFRYASRSVPWFSGTVHVRLLFLAVGSAAQAESRVTRFELDFPALESVVLSPSGWALLVCLRMWCACVEFAAAFQLFLYRFLACSCLVALRPNKKLDLVVVGVLRLWFGCLRDDGCSRSLLQAVFGWANLKERIIREGPILPGSNSWLNCGSAFCGKG